MIRRLNGVKTSPIKLDWFSGSMMIGLFLFTIPLQARTLEGKVVSVADGDTLTVLDGAYKRHRIRLDQIDAPESRQDFGKRSKQSLASLVFGKRVVVDIVKIDQYRRSVGTVMVGRVDANREQVRRGMAWVYRKYARDSAYYRAEEDARSKRIGLWSQPNPIAPWEFRRAARAAKARAQRPEMVATKARSSFTCGGKRFCQEIRTCAEAVFQLETCGLSRLDGDGDGVPCEALCKSAVKNRTR